MVLAEITYEAEDPSAAPTILRRVKAEERLEKTDRRSVDPNYVARGHEAFLQALQRQGEQAVVELPASRREPLAGQDPLSTESLPSVRDQRPFFLGSTATVEALGLTGRADALGIDPQGPEEAAWSLVQLLEDMPTPQQQSLSGSDAGAYRDIWFDYRKRQEAVLSAA